MSKIPHVLSLALVYAIFCASSISGQGIQKCLLLHVKNPVFFIFYVLILHSFSDESWQLGPFVKQDAVNPIMGPLNYTTFFCPIRQEAVNWEKKDIFNPGAILKDGKVHILYRAGI